MEDLNHSDSLRRRVFRDVPWASRAAGHAPLKAGSSYGQLVARLAEEGRGVGSLVTALALARLCAEEGLQAWAYEFGFRDQLTHAVTLVRGEDGAIRIEDAVCNAGFEQDALDVLRSLDAGEGARRMAEGQARKLCLIDTQRDAGALSAALTATEARDLPAAPPLRRVETTITAAVLIADAPNAPRAFATLRRCGLPADLDSLMLFPLRMFDAEGRCFDRVEDMPVLGRWFVERDSGEGGGTSGPAAGAAEALALLQADLEVERGISAKLLSTARTEAKDAQAALMTAAEERTVLAEDAGALRLQIEALTGEALALGSQNAAMLTQLDALAGETSTLRAQHADAVASEAQLAQTIATLTADGQAKELRLADLQEQVEVFRLNDKTAEAEALSAEVLSLRAVLEALGARAEEQAATAEMREGQIGALTEQVHALFAERNAWSDRAQASELQVEGAVAEQARLAEEARAAENRALQLRAEADDALLEVAKAREDLARQQGAAEQQAIERAQERADLEAVAAASQQRIEALIVDLETARMEARDSQEAARAAGAEAEAARLRVGSVLQQAEAARDRDAAERRAIDLRFSEALSQVDAVRTRAAAAERAVLETRIADVERQRGEVLHRTRELEAAWDTAMADLQATNARLSAAESQAEAEAAQAAAAQARAGGADRRRAEAEARAKAADRERLDALATAQAARRERAEALAAAQAADRDRVAAQARGEAADAARAKAEEDRVAMAAAHVRLLDSSRYIRLRRQLSRLLNGGSQ